MNLWNQSARRFAVFISALTLILATIIVYFNNYALCANFRKQYFNAHENKSANFFDLHLGTGKILEMDTLESMKKLNGSDQLIDKPNLLMGKKKGECAHCHAHVYKYTKLINIF